MVPSSKTNDYSPIGRQRASRNRKKREEKKKSSFGVSENSTEAKRQTKLNLKPQAESRGCHMMISFKRNKRRG